MASLGDHHLRILLRAGSTWFSPFQDSARGRLVSGPCQLRAQAALTVPRLWGQHGRGGEDVREGVGLQGLLGSRLLLGSCELPVLSRLAGLIGAHLCFYGSAEDVSAA